MHKFLSTACHHRRHADCGRVCEFCGDRCLCLCHRRADELLEPARSANGTPENVPGR